MRSTGYIKISKPGLYSSIQDLGRTAYLAFGVPIGGAMDRYAHKLANLYLQNEPRAATLEITLTGPELQFSRETQIVITGGDFSPKINGKPVPNSVVIPIKPQDQLSFGFATSGVRAYLGIKHGFQTPARLGSRGWTRGITPSFRLEQGMKLPYTPSSPPTGEDEVGRPHAIVAEEEINRDDPVGVFPGPEFNSLCRAEQESLIQGVFKIGSSGNRMGMQLEGHVKNRAESIITGPVLPGTVQLTPSGRLIVLMRDCQTTGGYPRVLQLTERGIDQMAQKAVGEEVRWQRAQLEGTL